jgi:hypothetical protein
VVDGRSRADIVGMAVGGAVPVIAVVVGCLADPPLLMLVIAGFIGVPLGIVSGSYHGVEARGSDARSAFDLAIRMAVQAVVVGDLVIGAIATIGLTTAGPSGSLIGIAATLGALVILGLPALAFTLVWVAAMRVMPRALVGDEPGPAR